MLRRPTRVNFQYTRKETEKQDLVRTLERLYQCRDLEISNLWQRSVFLSVFMILAFSGYGYFLSQILFSKNSQIDISCTQNLVAIGLTSLASIFSILWIKMAKSSKAWYEVYENGITDFEEEYQKELGIPSNYRMGCIKRVTIDNNYFSVAAGAYSPSKINVVLGQICLLVWASLLGAHCYYAYTAELHIENTVYYIIAVAILLGAIFWNINKVSKKKEATNRMIMKGAILGLQKVISSLPSAHAVHSVFAIKKTVKANFFLEEKFFYDAADELDKIEGLNRDMRQEIEYAKDAYGSITSSFASRFLHPTRSGFLNGD